jgi:hypothetical protein
VKILLILFAILSSTSFAYAQCTLSGRLNGGEDLWRVIDIVVSEVSGPVRASVQVRSDGTYLVRNLPYGSYSVTPDLRPDAFVEFGPEHWGVVCRPGTQEQHSGLDFTVNTAGAVTVEQACRNWCNANSECVKCSTRKRCGLGYKRLRSFSGSGAVWYACKAYGEDNHEACEEWCEDNSACVKCDTRKGCGSGYKNLRSFTGSGRNWHACRHR